MKNLLCLLLILTSLNIKAQQTYSISGTVNDNKGESLPNATVFISNSKYAMATDNKGMFEFRNIQPGTYEIVIKMLGYEPVIQSVAISTKSIRIIAILEESNTLLHTATIRAKDPNREKYMALFIKNFIGETANSKYCELLNPDVLDFHFHRDKNMLEASANDFLIVENKALGYRIKYLLMKFELYIKGNVCNIKGAPYFEELPGGEKRQQEWGNNRKIAYLSSKMHFYRALSDNQLKEEGFTVYSVNNEPAMKNFYGLNVLPFGYLGKLFKAYYLSPTDINALFKPGAAGNRTLISTKRIITETIKKKAVKDTVGLQALYIVYTGIKESPLFYDTGTRLDLHFALRYLSQVSEIVPLNDTVTVTDKIGSLTPPEGFRYAGYWAWFRLADLTPLDYFVSSSQKESNKK